jgi:hypothetical protein
MREVAIEQCEMQWVPRLLSMDLDAAHRLMAYKETAHLEGVDAGSKALIATFKVKSYGRCVATSKPLLTEA